MGRFECICIVLYCFTWFSPGTPVSSINKTDLHDIAEISLKVALNTLTPYIVLQLASRLKKFDPEKQQVGEDSEDPMWLQHLQRINQGFEVCIRSNTMYKTFQAFSSSSCSQC